MEETGQSAQEIEEQSKKQMSNVLIGKSEVSRV